LKAEFPEASIVIIPTSYIVCQTKNIESLFLYPLYPLFKTYQNRIKTIKNSTIFAQNRSKVSENSSKFAKILQNFQFTCAFLLKSDI